MLKGWALTPVWGADMDQTQRKGWAFVGQTEMNPEERAGRGLALLASLALAQAALSSGMWLWLWLLLLQASQSPQS